MNVFHKVLVKIFELTGGKDNVDVDLADLLKKEGFFPSIDSISKQLLDESWITEAGRKHIVRITHWGTAEAKRVNANGPDSTNEVAKNSNRLLNDLRELITMVEEFASKPESKKLDLIDGRINAVQSRSAEIRKSL